ncbi:hypothetical protein B0G84_4776 [Paraburkholderia sp. BL8N3]|jgi:hypothetical protein|nr:hypothetical protein [Paraburkholderia sp. BL8N3]TCK39438.1 hypothetical protein B0G84_4776 [Paraburkholderia sp. BL8N3]
MSTRISWVSTVTFLSEGIARHVAKHGTRPLRMEISPETRADVLRESGSTRISVSGVHADGGPKETFDGVPLKIVAGSVPKLICQTGLVEII